MAESWEIKASKARSIAADAPARILREKKKNIMSSIKQHAERGYNAYKFVGHRRNEEQNTALCLWLTQLGYTVEEEAPLIYLVKW